MKNDTLTNTNKTKGDLLEHYARREPKAFVQIDCWYGGKMDDDIFHADAAGRTVTSGRVEELMLGTDVRILIEPDGDPKEVVALLREAADMIVGQPDVVKLSFYNTELQDVSTWHRHCPYCSEHFNGKCPVFAAAGALGRCEYIREDKRVAPIDNPLDVESPF